MVTLEWTGQSMRGTGLLYQDYTDLANVLEDGQLIGEVLALPDGFYRPSVDGLTSGDCATPDQAMRKVSELWHVYRAPRGTTWAADGDETDMDF